MTAAQRQNALPTGHKLHWYEIQEILGQGAFGVTYLARDINLDRLVAIKEYMPGQLCSRIADLSLQPLSDEHREEFDNGLQRFISEARTLTRFEHPNLIRVFNVFEENNTAYMVMNYEQGETLQRILKTRTHFQESELLRILLPLMDGLQKMHATGFIHRDIKPGNVFIRSDGSPVLLDFGSARQTMTENPQTLTNFVSPGYAPIEQYTSKSDKQGPWTDIYGLGATLYKLITGAAPPNPVDRGETMADEGQDAYVPLAGKYDFAYTGSFLAAIDRALAFRAQDRPATIAEWRDMLGVDEDDIDTMPAQAAERDVQTLKIRNTSDSEAETIQSPAAEQTAATVRRDDSDATTVQVTETGRRSFLARRMLPLATGLSALVFLGVFFIWQQSGTDGTPSPVVDATTEQPRVTPAQPLAEPETESGFETDTALSTGERPATAAAQDQNITQLLERARANIDDLQLTTPADDNAYDQYRQVLALEPGNSAAEQGLHDIADKYIDLAYSARQSGEMEKANYYLQKAEEIWPKAPRLADARAAMTAPQQPGSGDGEPGIIDRVRDWTRENVKTREKSPEEIRHDERIRRAMGGS